MPTLAFSIFLVFNTLNYTDAKISTYPGFVRVQIDNNIIKVKSLFLWLNALI